MFQNYKFLYTERKYLRNRLKNKIPYFNYEKIMKKIMILKEGITTNLQIKYNRLKEEDYNQENDEFDMKLDKSVKLIKLHNLLISSKYRTSKLFEYNMSYSDKEMLEDLFKNLTTYSINLFPKLKAVIKYRVINYKKENPDYDENVNDLKNDVFEEILYCFTNKNFWNNETNTVLFDYEKEILDEIESISFIVEHFIKNTMLEESLVYYLNLMRDTIPFFINLIDIVDIQLKYIKSSYKELFNNYCVYPTTPLMYIIQLSMYYEYLILDNIDNEENRLIKSLSLSSGPLLTKVLQKIASMTEIDIEKRNILSVCYGNLQKLINSEIESIKEYILSPTHLDTNQNYSYISEKLDFSTPLSVASVGQVNVIDFEEKEYILKFVKPRTILNILSEIYLVRDVIYPLINKNSENNDIFFNKKKSDYLKYIIMHMLYEFNFDKEKSNLAYGKNNYEKININVVEQPLTEPFHLYNIPHIWMNKVNGKSLSSIFSNNEYLLCAEILPEMKKLIFGWIYNVLFQDGFFHADLHPGNIIIDENKKITLIDFGNCFSLSNKEKVHLINAIKYHLKLLNLIEREYIFDTDVFSNFCKNPLKIFKLIRKKEDKDYLYYINEISQSVFNTVELYPTEEEKSIFSNKILNFLKGSKWNKCFGSFCECLLNNSEDIGRFSGSRVMEFTKGIYILEKTWNLFLSYYEKNQGCKKENPKIIEIAFKQIKKLNILKKIKLVMSFIWK
jgi:hypothetical protein